MLNRKTFGALALVVIAWAPWLVPAAYSAVWQWSETASSNASADPQINWREGQPPSSVNDSARAMMAALAAYRDDISGLLSTGGTSTAYTVTTNQGLCASPSTVPQDGQQLALTMNATNGTGATLQADGCTAYPIQSAAGVAAPAASLISGSPYTFRYSVANSAWMLRDFYGSAFTVPLGGMIPYTGTTSPNSNFILPAGQCISTTTYASYWALMGSPASGSCPGGQFAVIDLRSKTLVALDNLNGTAANLLTTSSTGCGTAMTTVGATCANGAEGETMALSALPNYAPGFTGNNSGQQFAYTNSLQDVNFGSSGDAGSWVKSITYGGVATPTGTVGSINGGVSQTKYVNVQPTIAVTYLLRVM
jgi:hypothetical protein